MKKKKTSSKKAAEKRARREKRGSVALLILFACLLLIIGYALLKYLPAQSGEAETPVVFSEVMTANASTWPSEDGVYRDWIELWNPSGEAVDLSGWHITNTADTRGARDCGLGVLQPGERQLVYADKDTLGFSLSSNGVTLYLSDARGLIRRTLEVPPLAKGESYALMSDDKYITSETPTPGIENTSEAWQKLTSETVDEGVYINEVMASNVNTLKTQNGDTPDYVELYNAGSGPVNLSGWHLTDDISDRHAYAFPDVDLAANSYLLVYASGSEEAVRGELHAPFKLSAKADTVYLIDPQGRIASRMSWTDLDEDEALSRLDNNKETRKLLPSPGREDATAEELEHMRAAVPADPLTHNEAGLYINEILASGGGENGDWIELYNDSGREIDLSDHYLSDNTHKPRKWAFPAGTKIASKGYLCVRLLPKGAQTTKPLDCTDFRLSSAGGETVLLADGEGNVVDKVSLYYQRGGISYGRAKDKDTYRYFTDPTPGAANASKSYGGVASEVTLSHTGGWVDGSELSLEMSVDNDVNIYYTTDNSEPNAKSHVYSSPLRLKDNTIVKLIAWKEDCVPTSLEVHTYLFGVKSSLRTVCVSGHASELTNNSDGVLKTGARWPREVYVEVYDYDGTPMISQGCELMTQGRSSRVKEEYKQKAFKLTAKRQYGKARFKSKLFTNSDVENYNSFLMRASGQDCYKSHMKDSVLTGLCRDMECYYQETELAAVYINGHYWGMYNMRQRVDPDTICQKHGWQGDEEKIDVITGHAQEATHGSSERYRAMLSYVRSHDFSNDSSVEGLRKYCNIESYLDYVIMMMYTAQEDLGNVRAYCNPAADDGQFRWAVYDLDLAFLIDKNSVNMWLNGNGDIGSITTTSNMMFARLMRNKGLKDYFLTRLGELLAGTLSSQNVVSKIDERAETIAAEMKRNCSEWDWKYSTWEKNVETMREYAQKRTGKLIRYAVKAFRLNEEQEEHYFGQAIENEKNSASK